MSLLRLGTDRMRPESSLLQTVLTHYQGTVCSGLLASNRQSSEPAGTQSYVELAILPPVSPKWLQSEVCAPGEHEVMWLKHDFPKLSIVMRALC